MRTCFLNPSEFTAVVWKDNSYNLKKMSWNDNLQNNRLEQQFSKKMSGTTIPKSMAKTTTDRKKLPRTTIYKQKKYSAERHLQKKSWPERKFAEKGVQNTNLKKVVQNDYLRKISCQEQYAEFAKKK